ncbi:hypothetical protein [Glutamicibacter creatinolyticus]|uniref:hypothetical protein n=1 Tax=Glutamicibacter creatinolyticus TaxID=162496 RepID=UPI0031DC213A
MTQPTTYDIETAYEAYRAADRAAIKLRIELMNAGIRPSTHTKFRELQAEAERLKDEYEDMTEETL